MISDELVNDEAASNTAAAAPCTEPCGNTCSDPEPLIQLKLADPPTDKKADSPTGEAIPDILEISKMATVEIFGLNGEMIETEQIHRGLFPVFRYLLARRRENADGELRVFAYLTAMTDKGGRKLKIVDATIDEAIASLTERMQPASVVMQRLQLTISQIAEVSSLKGVILTAVFNDSGKGSAPAGFGFLSESILVTNEDIALLGGSATSQLDMFKDAMRKNKNVEFPGDSRIVLPGQSGIFV